MKANERRKRERESHAREKKMDSIIAALQMLKSDRPIPNFKIAEDARAQLIVDLDADLRELIRTELRARPDLYVQHIDGRWFVVEAYTKGE